MCGFLLSVAAVLQQIFVVLLTRFRRFQNFFFSHIMLVESYVNKLKLAVDEALAPRSRAIICKVIERFSK